MTERDSSLSPVAHARDSSWLYGARYGHRSALGSGRSAPDLGSRSLARECAGSAASPSPLGLLSTARGSSAASALGAPSQNSPARFMPAASILPPTSSLSRPPPSLLSLSCSLT